MRDRSGDCLGCGKTARAHKREARQALTNRAGVTCNKRARGSLFALSLYHTWPAKKSTCARRRIRAAAPVCLPQCQALFTLGRAPLKRARRRHGPSSTHEATLAPVRRDSAGVRNQCQKKITPRRPREGITRPRKYAVTYEHTGAPSRSASPASARPSAATPTTRTTAARS